MRTQFSFFVSFTLLIFSFGISNTAYSQAVHQTLRGRIFDVDTQQPIPYANVIVLKTDPIIGAVSDEDGYFKMVELPLGRVDVQATFLGYEPRLMSNVDIISGKETVLEISMKEAFSALQEIVVSAKQSKADVLNEMAQLSARNLSVEESNRYAGGIGDPARLVSSFAGVSSTGEGNNDIIVRGNNPRFVQWRLEGTEIPNPNHFGSEGLTGGPVNALNNKMLANSEFYTGAFAPQYGNVLSSIFDVKFRNGNSETHERSFSLGLLGVDVTAEGPIDKKSRTSYLANYRYSTLGLLDKLGVIDFGGVPEYQDLSYKFFIPTKRLGTFSLFGLAGNSQIKQSFNNVADSTLVSERFSQRSGLMILGAKHFMPINESTYINSTVSYSSNTSDNEFSRIYETPELKPSFSSAFANNAIRVNSTYNQKINNRHQVQVGLVATHFSFDFKSRYLDESAGTFLSSLDQRGDANSLQGFLSWKWRVTENLSWVNGIHTQMTSQNDEITFEPRSSLRFQANKKLSFSAGFGVHSQMTSLSNYFTIVHDENGAAHTPNSNLSLLKAQHYVIGTEYRLSKNLNVKMEAYYQYLFDIPVDVLPSSFTVLNQLSELADRALINNGFGRNYGIEGTLEKFFADRYYFLVTGSLYKAQSKSSDAVWRDTRFNGDYTLNGLFGKDFKLRRNNVWSVNSKFSLQGGRKLLLIDLPASVAAGEAVYNEANAFETKADDIMSINFSTSYRINKKRTSHEIKIDIQNLTNRQAIIDYYYNDISQSIEKIQQLSMLPILSYTLNF